MCGRRGVLDSGCFIGGALKDQVVEACEYVLKEMVAFGTADRSELVEKFAYADELCDVFLERREELLVYFSSSMARSCLAGAYLGDFDWSVKLVVGSDRLAGTMTPLLLLELSICKPDGQVDVVLLELDLHELETLCSTFDDIGTSLEKLKIK
mmetsp:Transcript_9159/g.17289  ORF Transcript_9159/g.17289 Transcript_9159/m.17289 type:complete len:153 (+) Transcript_9159:574-1032(+)